MQDLVYHAFRHLLLTAQPQTLSEGAAEASTILTDASLQGPSSSYSLSEDVRLKELLQLQVHSGLKSVITISGLCFHNSDDLICC